jgi:hypothetical protein
MHLRRVKTMKITPKWLLNADLVQFAVHCSTLVFLHEQQRFNQV